MYRVDNILFDPITKQFKANINGSLVPVGGGTSDRGGVTKVNTLPETGEAGKIYYNTSDNTYYVYNNDKFEPIAKLGIINDLTTGGADKALSAEQGKNLKIALENLRTALANLAYGGTAPKFPWDEEDEPTGDISDYIQDGLVFHLDGINKGSVSGQWTDLIGDVDFPNHGATELENGWQFDGVNDWMGYRDSTKALSFYGDSCTIEVCFEDSKINQGAGSHDAGMFLVGLGASPAHGSNAQNALYVNTVHNGNGTKYINGVYVGTSDSVWKDQLIDTIAKNTLSINEVRAFHNGVALETQNANHWASVSAGRTIGAQYHTNGNMTEFCSGKIFSIRVYNRILSEAEILQNQRVDNARFNLGLTLPE